MIRYRWCIASAAVGALLAGCTTTAAAPRPSAAPAAPTVAEVLAVCVDASGAAVVDDRPESGRLVRAYAASGGQLWQAGLGSLPYATAVGRCDTQALSSAVETWTRPDLQDPVAVVHSARGEVVWPGQRGYTKYRILAASGVGSGVVATSTGSTVTVRTQRSGKYADSHPMSTPDVDWALSPDGRTGVAYAYATASSVDLFTIRDGMWTFTGEHPVPDQIYQVFVSGPDRYLLRTQTDFILVSGGVPRRIAGVEQYSDALLTPDRIVLLRRWTQDNGPQQTEVHVYDDTMRMVFAHTYAAQALISATQDDIAVSVPGALTLVSGNASLEIATPPGRYVTAGYDGRLLAVGDDGLSEVSRPAEIG